MRLRELIREFSGHMRESDLAPCVELGVGFAAFAAEYDRKKHDAEANRMLQRAADTLWRRAQQERRRLERCRFEYHRGRVEHFTREVLAWLAPLRQIDRAAAGTEQSLTGLQNEIVEARTIGDIDDLCDRARLHLEEAGRIAARRNDVTRLAISVPRRPDPRRLQPFAVMHAALAAGIWQASGNLPETLRLEAGPTVARVVGSTVWAALASELPRHVTTQHHFMLLLADAQRRNTLVKRLARRTAVAMSARGVILSTKDAGSAWRSVLEQVEFAQWPALGEQAVMAVRVRVIEHLVRERVAGKRRRARPATPRRPRPGER